MRNFRKNKGLVIFLRYTLISMIIVALAIALSEEAYAITITYTYDNLSRVTKVDYSNGFIEEYTYDAAGNRLTLTVSSTNPLRGDINGDGNVDLVDAVIALQVISGMNPSGIRTDYTSSGTDVNGDGRISMEEVIYILQRISGLRQ